ncbi:TPA: proto-oncogene vav-like [Bos taurus]|nr:TPA: proto-oncogene vav-like [Bos taurus]
MQEPGGPRIFVSVGWKRRYGKGRGGPYGLSHTTGSGGGCDVAECASSRLPPWVSRKEPHIGCRFLCLKNIRTFLSTCYEKFGLKRSELFEAFDLFDVQDFGKVIYTLSALSWTPIAQNKGIILLPPWSVCGRSTYHLGSPRPFPTEESVGDEDIYSGLSDQIDDTVEEDEDLYDCVENEEAEGDEVYEDLMRSEPVPMPPKMTEYDKRCCCLREIQQTEEKYTDTLGSIQQHFMKPLQRFLKPQDVEIIFINIEEMKEALANPGASTLYQVFIKYKERFLIYGRYCSQVESASKHLDRVATAREDVQMKLEECSQRANNGRFTLRDLLMVPMQRVLKYHLLLQELVKHTQDAMEKDNLRLALDAMRDLAQCVNEVKRDNETLRQITNFQLSIENLDQSLAHYGRPKIDGELKITSVERRSKMDRYAFLLDKALLICKRRGDTYDLKDFVNLHSFQVRDDSSGERDNKKTSERPSSAETHFNLTSPMNYAHTASSFTAPQHNYVATDLLLPWGLCQELCFLRFTQLFPHFAQVSTQTSPRQGSLPDLICESAASHS